MTTEIIKKKYFFAVFIPIILFLFFIILLFTQLLANQDLFLINKFFFGLDYKEFYNASIILLEGDNPYKLIRFVTPPLSAYIAIPLSALDFSLSSKIFSIFSLMLFLLSNYYLIKQIDLELKVKYYLLNSIIIITGISYPVFFLFSRGNIDFLVISFLLLGIYNINKSAFISSLFLSISILLKIYPFLVFIPLLMMRRKKILFYTTAISLILIIVNYELSFNYISTILFMRVGTYRYDENASIVNFFLWIHKLISILFYRNSISSLNQMPWLYLSYAYYFICLFIVVVCDWIISKNNHFDKTDSLFYFPFMVAIPSTVYQYELIIFIPLLILVTFLWDYNLSKEIRRTILLIAISIIFTQFQVVGFAKIFNIVYPHFISSIGVFLAITSISIYKYSIIKSRIFFHEI